MSCRLQHKSHTICILNNRCYLKGDDVIRPEAEPCGFVRTLNKMGYMTSTLDPYSAEYVNYCQRPNQYVLEIGAAYGVATIPSLQKGAYVVCNDLNPQHLQILWDNTPSKLRKRLLLKPGRCPCELDFPPNTFTAILASRVLHLLEPDKFETSISLFRHWLKPKGKIFIVAETPYLKIFKDFIPIYLERKKTNDQWPGLIEDVDKYLKIRKADIPDLINFFDSEVLRRVLEKYNFKIKKIGYISRLDFPEEYRLDGKESIGVIAEK